MPLPLGFPELGYHMDYSVGSVAPGIATSITLAPYNSKRVGLWLINAGTNGCRALPRGIPTSTNGILLATNSEGLRVLWKDWGSLVQSEWRGIAIAGSTNITVIELIFNQPGKDRD